MTGRDDGGSTAARRQASRTRTGRRAEDLVAVRLAAAGWRVLARNVRVGRSELDIVAVDPGPPPELVVVEVRADRSSAFGPPETRVDRIKVRNVYRGALGLRAHPSLPDGGPLPPLPIRVDVIAVELAPPLGEGIEPTTFRHIRAVIG